MPLDRDAAAAAENEIAAGTDVITPWLMTQREIILLRSPMTALVGKTSTMPRLKGLSRSRRN